MKYFFLQSLSFPQYSFVEIDHEIFSIVILSLPLIQKGQLSVFLARECAQNWLTAYRTKPAQKKCGEVN